MLFCPVEDRVIQAACVRDIEMGKGLLTAGHPAPVDGGDVTVAHYGLAEGVDAVVYC